MVRTANKPKITIELTREQREQMQAVLGRAASKMDLTAEVLEERVAPSGVDVDPTKWDLKRNLAS